MTTMGARSDRAFPELVVILAGVCAAMHVAKLSPALPVLGQSLGVTLLQAGFLLSLVQLAGMLFGLLVGLAADEVGLKRSMGVGALVAFAPLPYLEGDALEAGIRYLGILFFSMVGGLIPGTLFSLAVVVAPDEDSVSTTVGWMQQWSAIGQFVVPPLVAWVAGIAGGWHWTWAVTGTCTILGLVVARQVARPGAR